MMPGDAPAENAGSWLMVYDRSNGYSRVEMSEAPLIDAAVSDWIEGGGTRDKVLHLSHIDGATYRILASLIGSWIDSTPEIRAREYERDAALKAERPAEPWREDG